MQPNLRYYQIALENTFGKFQTLTKVLEEIHGTPNLVEGFQLHGLEEKCMVRFLAHALISKAVPFSSMVSVRPKKVSLETATSLLEQATTAGYFSWDGEYFRTPLSLPESLQESLKLMMYPLPMVVRPNKLQNNFQSGYLTRKNDVAMLRRVPTGELVLPHLNKLNATALRINEEVAEFAQTVMPPPKRKDWESFQEYGKRIRHFVSWRANIAQVHGLLKEAPYWYLLHKYDKRGRTYVCGYHVNYQGPDYCKAVVELAHPVKE
jgi:hypothetical protein